MRKSMILSVAGAALMLAGCANTPPSLSPGAAPVGAAAGGQTAVTPEALGAGGVNRGYYSGSDPNFPRGTIGGTRSP